VGNCRPYVQLSVTISATFVLCVQPIVAARNHGKLVRWDWGEAMTRLLLFAFVFAVSATHAVAGPLHNAARDGDVEQVGSLIASGEDVNKRNRMLGWPIHQAALNDYVGIAEMLIAAGADVNVEHKIFGTPLHTAAQKGSFGVAALLLENGADPNSRYGDGSTPLHFAAGRGHAALVELLVVNGADIAAKTTRLQFERGDYTALHSAGREDHFDIVALLQSLQARDAPDQPISALLAVADVEAGRVTFENRYAQGHCGGCHSISDDVTATSMRGPHLQGIVGRPKASIVGFEYSDALKRLGGVWTTIELNAFIAGAQDYAPGAIMEFWGVADPVERANIIAYLQAASE
jgi:cytochrome c2